MTQSEVLKALTHVMEPDLKKDLVSLNMIREIQFEGNKVSFTVMLTTPACPLKEKIKKDCIDAIHQHLDCLLYTSPSPRDTQGKNKKGLYRCDPSTSRR